MQIEARYRIVTPLFAGGADPIQPRLQAASFRGVWRFWWRALAWSHFGGDLQAIRTAEAQWFGAAGPGPERAGRGCVVIRQCGWTEDRPGVWSPPPARQVPGVSYLGYGVIAGGAGVGRQALRPGAGFEVWIEVRPPRRGSDAADPKQSALLLRALQAIGLLGGLGARVRRGFGSVVLESLRVDGQEQAVVADTPEGYRRALATCLGAASQERQRPPYTAVSAEGGVWLAVPPRSAASRWEQAALDVLNALGERWRAVRQEVDPEGGQRARTLVRGAAAEVPARVALGLPLGFYFRGGPQPQTLVLQPNGGGIGQRRASPVWLHVHAGLAGPAPQVWGVVACWPSLFLPDDTRLDAGGRAVRPPAADAAAQLARAAVQAMGQEALWP